MRYIKTVLDFNFQFSHTGAYFSYRPLFGRLVIKDNRKCILYTWRPIQVLKKYEKVVYESFIPSDVWQLLSRDNYAIFNRFDQNKIVPYCLKTLDFQDVRMSYVVRRPSFPRLFVVYDFCKDFFE